MIKINHSSIYSTNASSLMVSYTRHVQISCGNYPVKEDLLNFITIIKNNLLESEYYTTNVLGGKTDWNLFNEHPLFLKFLNWFINKHQPSNEYLRHFYDKRRISNSWGNELKTGDSVRDHHHNDYHGILYLTEGNPLILYELDIEIHPKPGDYYFFPPFIQHYVPKVEGEVPPRYNLIFNIGDKQDWEKNKRLNVHQGIVPKK